jgi:hypothetical protein
VHPAFRHLPPSSSLLLGAEQSLVLPHLQTIPRRLVESHKRIQYKTPHGSKLAFAAFLRSEASKDEIHGVRIGTMSLNSEV